MSSSCAYLPVNITGNITSFNKLVMKYLEKFNIKLDYNLDCTNEPSKPNIMTFNTPIGIELYYNITANNKKNIDIVLFISQLKHINYTITPNITNTNTNIENVSIYDKATNADKQSEIMLNYTILLDNIETFNIGFYNKTNTSISKKIKKSKFPCLVSSYMFNIVKTYHIK